METVELFEVKAKLRTEKGKNANRRLRRQGGIPAILYGIAKAPTALTISANTLNNQLKNEAFYTKILTIDIDGQREPAVLKDLHRHPSTSSILHADFQRIDEHEKLYKAIPIHFLNEEQCPGVKTGGGILSRQLTEVEVRCLPKDLPEFITVDLSELQLNAVIHLSDLKLPSNVEIVTLIQGEAYDLPVVSVQSARAEKETDETTVDEAE